MYLLSSVDSHAGLLQKKIFFNCCHEHSCGCTQEHSSVDSVHQKRLVDLGAHAIISGGKDFLSREASLDAHSVIPHRQLGSFCSHVMTGLHKGTCICFLGLLLQITISRNVSFHSSGNRSQESRCQQCRFHLEALTEYPCILSPGFWWPVTVSGSQRHRSSL